MGTHPIFESDFDCLTEHMSTLKEALAAFEQEQSQVEVDHEDEDDGSKAKLSENDTSHYRSVSKSKLRGNTVASKYTGVKVTRDQLEAESDSDDDDEAALMEELNRESKSEKSEKKEEEKEEDLTKLFAVEAGSDEEDEEGDDDDREGEEDEMEVDGDNLADYKVPYQDRHDADDESIASDDAGELDNGLDELDIFKRREESKPVEALMSEQEKNEREGGAITRQMDVFDRMIKTRIKLQRVMQTAALLPKSTQMGHFQGRTGNQQLLTETRQLLSSLVEKTQNLTSLISLKPGQKRSWAEFTQQRRSAFDQTWESVKHSMNQGATHPNVALASIMGENERLIRRSRMKKTNQGVRCGESQEEKEDHEQYDDTGLYLTLLRGVINTKTNAPDANSADPIEMTRHWMRLNQHETKRKKSVVDTKASKGRKIRYEIHPKMVGFAVKRDQGSWSHQQRNQLFRGVFQ